MKKVIFTTGGTGGHIYPAISIADKMKDCLQIENRHPAILLRIGYAHPVAYSPRKQASSIIFNK